MVVEAQGIYIYMNRYMNPMDIRLAYLDLLNIYKFLKLSDNFGDNLPTCWIGFPQTLGM